MCGCISRSDSFVVWNARVKDLYAALERLHRYRVRRSEVALTFSMCPAQAAGLRNSIFHYWTLMNYSLAFPSLSETFLAIPLLTWVEACHAKSALQGGSRFTIPKGAKIPEPLFQEDRSHQLNYGDFFAAPRLLQRPPKIRSGSTIPSENCSTMCWASPSQWVIPSRYAHAATGQ